MPKWLEQLNCEVVACRKCPRLVAYRERVAREKRRAYADWEYWGKPVPGFGDLESRVLILGLAPGAHGSNRTGRMFTGDSSGVFLFGTFYETGFANQPSSTNRGDGLKLKDAYITATIRCAPPGNKPLPEEIRKCAPFLDRELASLKNVRVVVALGRIAFDAYLSFLKRQGLLPSRLNPTSAKTGQTWGTQKYVFGHGAQYRMPDGRVLLASYHPSNQNTQTGKLTRRMFTEIFRKARKAANRVIG